MPHHADIVSAGAAAVRALALTTVVATLCACDAQPTSVEEELGGAPNRVVFVDNVTPPATAHERHATALTTAPEPVPAPPPATCSADWAAVAPPQALLPTNARPFDHAGLSVALAGSWLFAGADGDDTAGTDAGAVHLFQDTGPNGWSHRSALVAPDALPGDQLGWAVAADDDVAAFGAPGRGAGLVWTYQRTGCGWAPRVAISGAGLGPEALFGAAVATDGAHLLVGAPGVDDARVYRADPATGWVLETVFALTTAPAGDHQFGAAVAVSDGLAVVGAPAAGMAVVYERHGREWSAAATLSAPPSDDAGRFGTAVALTQNVVVVGAEDAAPAGVAGAGAAYVFVRTTDGWAHAGRLTAPDQVSNARFGGAVHISGAVLAVGAWDGADGAGAAYLFEHSKAGWLSRARLTDPHGAAGDRLGLALALDDGRIGVGAWSADAAERDAGKILVFEAPGGCGPGAAPLTAVCLP